MHGNSNIYIKKDVNSHTDKGLELDDVTPSQSGKFHVTKRVMPLPYGLL